MPSTAHQLRPTRTPLEELGSPRESNSHHGSGRHHEPSCHREPGWEPGRAMTLVFDGAPDERALVGRLTRAYGVGREIVTARCRQHVWQTDRREVSLSAAGGRLQLCVARPA